MEGQIHIVKVYSRASGRRYIGIVEGEYSSKIDFLAKFLDYKKHYESSEEWDTAAIKKLREYRSIYGDENVKLAGVVRIDVNNYFDRDYVGDEI